MLERGNISEKEPGHRRIAPVGDEAQAVKKAVCDSCGTTDYVQPCARDIEWEKGSFDVFFCVRCQAGFTFPFPSHEVLTNLYSSDC